MNTFQFPAESFSLCDMNFPSEMYAQRTEREEKGKEPEFQSVMRVRDGMGCEDENG